ncbi:hypothetical protein [Streptomyces luteireticuli]|uniref:hypothetical protein n=1 Tax=Streptomyces luteireticuli TaxID=173858 RepID=UPI003558E9A0
MTPDPTDFRYTAPSGSSLYAQRTATEPDGDTAVALTTTSHRGQGPFVEVPPDSVGQVAAGLLALAGEQPAARGREVSRALTEVRTVLSRAESALSALTARPTELLHESDGRGPLWDEHGEWVRAYDPDHEEIRAALGTVIALLSPWRRTGRPAGTERERLAELKGVPSACGLLWAGRVAADHTRTTITTLASGNRPSPQD